MISKMKEISDLHPHPDLSSPLPSPPCSCLLCMFPPLRIHPTLPPAETLLWKDTPLKLRGTQIFLFSVCLFFFLSFVSFDNYLYFDLFFLTRILHSKAKELQPIWPTQVL